MTRNGAAMRAQALHASGFNCAEAVLKAVTDELGVASELVPRAASCFGGRLGPVLDGRCGALSGGLMALGCATGRTYPDESLDVPGALALELKRRFEEGFGSVLCPTTPTPFGGTAYSCACAKVIAGTADLACGLLEETLGPNR
ncbi:C-GCAxxG-C-C family protein [Mesoterricola silvestris]|uniref:C_GCAxxG_C_C family protein n=1 Tax=Mesoterricola silvestris TaxID=2927979 RepID=A0AA48KAN5_9BACT|nr:C-GCAxxG-C-C family protein [Mesoterricola silvestris]BDU73492.1 hypothetical protein METEAL_26660 [Mesoterricola silvestris]